MIERTIKQGDFVLITDKEDYYYLKIGEVVRIEYEDDGDIYKYMVRFKNDYQVQYAYDLPEMCRVLKFEAR